MLWFIVVPLLLMVIFSMWLWNDVDDVPLTVLGVIIGLLVGEILALGVNGIAYPLTHSNKYVADSAPLANIRDASSLHGSFFLGSGTVDSTPVYYFYKEIAPGQYVLDNADASDSVVIETTGTPHYEHISDHSSNVWLSVFREGDIDQYRFYVPPGSVVQNYTLGVDSMSNSR